MTEYKTGLVIKAQNELDEATNAFSFTAARVLEEQGRVDLARDMRTVFSKLVRARTLIDLLILMEEQE